MTSRIGTLQQPQRVSRQPAVDMSPAILASLQAVRDNPTDATVNAQAAELNRALGEAGVADRGWEKYLLLNFKKTVTGQDPAALNYFRTNVSRASQVLTPSAVNRALTMATQAQRKAAEKDRLPLSSAQQLMSQVTSRRYAVSQDNTTKIISTMRNAGLNQSAQSTAAELFRTYQRTVDPLAYGTKGLGALQQDLARLETLIPTAAKQGSIDLPTQKKLLGQVSQWKKQFAPKTPEQVQQANASREAQRVEGMKSPQMQPYRQMLDDLKYLRSTFAERNGVSLGAGSYQRLAAEQLISKIPGFEKAIESGSVEQAKRFMENNLGDRPKNQSIRSWADQLKQTDAKTKAFFDNAHAIIEQFGPVAYVASKILSNTMKAQREGKPMSEAAYNTAIDVASYAVGKKYTGKVGDMVQRTVLDFARNVAASVAKDPSPAGIGKALTNGFKDAVLGIGGHAVKELSSEQRQELAKALYTVGSKLFDVNVIKPAIDRAFAP